MMILAALQIGKGSLSTAMTIVAAKKRWGKELPPIRQRQVPSVVSGQKPFCLNPRPRTVPQFPQW